jgi:hypothetical protein
MIYNSFATRMVENCARFATGEPPTAALESLRQIKGLQCPRDTFLGSWRKRQQRSRKPQAVTTL